ncbi:MAG: hypothetical protein K1X75_07835 [Leptospirales bacterium]|nr:hypothetical protein [Leptospirales bacterium]
MLALSYRLEAPRLRRQIAARLRLICRGDAKYESRTLHSGAFARRPLRLHARRRVARRSPCCYDLDSGAHFFSLIQNDLLPDFFERVDDVLFLPELNASEERLLSHCYWPAARIMAFYLFPLRLDQCTPADASRISASQLLHYGLSGAVLECLQGAELSAKGLHTFIAPLSAIEGEELRQMEALDQRYRQAGVHAP